MKLSVAVLCCVLGLALSKPDEAKERKYNELRAMGTVKRLFLESTKAIKPEIRKSKRIALGKRRANKDIGAGEAQTISINSDQYRTNMEEEFVVRAASSSDMLKLSFSHFDLESPAGCGMCWDYVEVFDGPNKDAPKLGQWCGQDMPPEVMASGSVMTVLFQSDCSVTASGFTAQASIVNLNSAELQTSDPQAGCGQVAVMAGQTGYIESSNYPGNYGDNEVCRWYIVADSGTITLEIESFEVEPYCNLAYGCIYDSVKIKDGDITMADMCGWSLNSNTFGGQTTWTTSGSTAVITFTSDGSVSGSGFRIKYTINGDAMTVVETPASEAVPAPAPAAPAPAPEVNLVPGTVWDDFDAIMRYSLFAHNTVRALHRNTPALSWSSSLEASSKEWALQLSAEDAFYHSDGNYGENLYWSMGYPTEGSIARAVFDWYEERHSYSYNQGNSRDGGVIGHFTQVVWDNTSQVGCAVVTKGSEVYVVCQYSPPGNYIGQYTSHVHNRNSDVDENYPADNLDLDDM